MTEVIHTHRLRLRPVATGDVERLQSILHLPDVRCHLHDGKLVAEAFVAGLVADSLDPSSLTAAWRIETASEAVIGLVCLGPQSPATLRLRAISWRSLELLVALHPEWWGQGLAAEVVDAMAAHAFAEAMTFALVGPVEAPNVRGHRLMTHCGFKVLGEVDVADSRLVVYERSL